MQDHERISFGAKLSHGGYVFGDGNNDERERSLRDSTVFIRQVKLECAQYVSPHNAAGAPVGTEEYTDERVLLHNGAR